MQFMAEKHRHFPFQLELVNNEDIDKELNRLPAKLQDIIAEYSSFFLEKDVHDMYQQNGEKLRELIEDLKQQGFDNNAIKISLRVFDFQELPGNLLGEKGDEIYKKFFRSKRSPI